LDGIIARAVADCLTRPMTITKTMQMARLTPTQVWVYNRQEAIMGNMHRAQLLLEPEQHEALAEISEQEGRSISDLVREIVRQYLAERDEETRKRAALEAMEELSRIRSRVREQHGIYPGQPLAEVRTEREEKVGELWRGEA
jgi:predicted DNA-binding protein